MKTILAAFLGLMAITAHAGEAEEVETAKQAISATMKDPGSAQFRNVTVIPQGEKKVVCGEINGKNSYGGYVGFRKFYVWTDDGSGRIKSNDPIMDKLVDLVCKA